jgi:amino acid transporter
MGRPQAMLGWVLGAALAACDGLVWAELGAAMPEAGGTYKYLGEMFPGKWGRWLSFLFVFQLMISAPLSVASGCIGLSQYAGFLWAPLAHRRLVMPVQVGWFGFSVNAGTGTLVAIAAVGIAVLLLYRKLSKMRWIATTMLAVVLVLMAWAMLTGLVHGHWANVVAFPADAWKLDGRFFSGLGAAMLIATYDYWGYYNVTFLGGEVRDPGRTIPRAVLISIAIVALLYWGLNASVLSVMGAPAIIAAQDIGARQALLATMMQTAWGPVFGAGAGAWLGKLAAVLVMVTAFASIFSLLLGYSRIPYAAARDGNYFRVFGRLHKAGFPHVSLLALGGMGIVFCFFSLADVIAALVVLRILVQFLMQHIGVIYLRKTQPEMKRPFRIWLYPLPPVLAICGFTYILIERANFQRELMGAGVVILLGAAVYVTREGMNASFRR